MAAARFLKAGACRTRSADRPVGTLTAEWWRVVTIAVDIRMTATGTPCSMAKVTASGTAPAQSQTCARIRICHVARVTG